MILLLYGDDTYRSRQRLLQLREAFKKKYDPAGTNCVRLDGSTLTLEEFAQHLSAGGFLVTKRFVTVENLFTAGKVEAQRELAEYLAARTDDAETIVVLWEGGEPTKAPVKRAKKKAKPAKAAKENPKALDAWTAVSSLAKCERFTPLEPAEVVKWIAATAKARGGGIERRAAERLASIAGSDLWRASNELDKLLHFAGTASVNEEHITTLVVAATEEDIFQFIEALGTRDRRRALQLLEGEFRAGMEPLYLVRMLAWQFRTLMAVRAWLDAGQDNAQAISRDIGVHPFATQKALRQARAFTSAEIEAHVQRLLTTEERLKTGRKNPEAELTMFVLETVGGGNR